jgi:hypothetical protein
MNQLLLGFGVTCDHYCLAFRFQIIGLRIILLSIMIVVFLRQSHF